jgi:hypothetical protein
MLMGKPKYNFLLPTPKAHFYSEPKAFLTWENQQPAAAKWK